MRGVLCASLLLAVGAHAAAPARLDLCDCDWATGGPDGLSCDGEGFILTGFQHVGRWAAGGGDIPLARARCCRPCLPGAGDDDDGDAPPPPLAVLSLDCHEPASTGPDGLLCESNTGGFVAGFASSRRVGGGGAAGAAYPVGAPRCCTPALLAPSGATAELARCDCVTVAGVSCFNGTDGGGASSPPSSRFLRGFRSWRLAPDGALLPAGPVECCAACAPDSDDPARDCGGGCRGRGACVLGACVCEPGFGGPDCGLRTDGLPDALQALMAAVTVVGTLVLAAVAGRAVRRAAGGASSDDDDDDGGPRAAARRLLAAADGGAGSVGSADTDASDAGEADDEEKGAGGGGAAADDDDDDPKASPASPPCPASDAAAAALAGAACAVCQDRPVQVVLVPCGHACTCRRCARRLTRCPVCRADTARRQRLWVGG